MHRQIKQSERVNDPQLFGEDELFGEEGQNKTISHAAVAAGPGLREGAEVRGSGAGRMHRPWLAVRPPGGGPTWQ